MTQPSWIAGPPRTILVATDLSPRCDRALDRAVALATQWGARLVVLHVLEESGVDVDDIGGRVPSWRRPADPAALARRELASDLGPLADRARIIIDQGDIAEAAIRAAEAEGAGLIVTGTARDELFGRFSLGRTVDRLLRRSRLPLLVVKNRPRGPYGHIAVASDFSESSRHALEAAAHIFPRTRAVLFHAYEAPLAGRLVDSAAYQREYRAVAAADCERFLKEASTPAGWPAPQVLLEHGSPASLLADYARDKECDLVVLGTHGRTAAFEMVIGSVAKEIMDRVHCDSLLIREPRAATEG